MKGTMAGELKPLETDSSDDDDVIIENTKQQQQRAKPTGAQKAKQTNRKPSSGFSILSNLKSLVGSKTLGREDMTPVMDKMRDHLIGA